MKRDNCTESCKGIIKEIKSRGLDYSSIITVTYKVNEITYELSEK